MEDISARQPFYISMLHGGSIALEKQSAAFLTELRFAIVDWSLRECGVSPLLHLMSLIIRWRLIIAIVLSWLNLGAVCFTNFSTPQSNAPIFPANRVITYGLGFTVLNIIFHLLFTQLSPASETWILGQYRHEAEHPYNKTLELFVIELDWRYQGYLMERQEQYYSQMRAHIKEGRQLF